MNPFAHFLLTRFNVAPNGQPAMPLGPGEGGLERRFDLFERVCLPFVDRQAEGAFQWLVFMDWGTPVPFKERMAALAVHYDFLRPVYCSRFDAETVLAEIRRRESPGAIRITTRLAGDAAIHPRFTKQIQETAEARLAAMDLAKGFFIRFPLGCLERNGAFYLLRDAGNAFASFVSAPECVRIVLAADSADGAGGMPTVFKHVRPMWCRAIHPDIAGVPLRGVYWPGGGVSEFASLVRDGIPRGTFWQLSETLRTSARCLFRR